MRDYYPTDESNVFKGCVWGWRMWVGGEGGGGWMVERKRSEWENEDGSWRIG